MPTDTRSIVNRWRGSPIPEDETGASPAPISPWAAPAAILARWRGNAAALGITPEQQELAQQSFRDKVLATRGIADYKPVLGFDSSGRAITPLDYQDTQDAQIRAASDRIRAQEEASGVRYTATGKETPVGARGYGRYDQYGNDTWVNGRPPGELSPEEIYAQAPGTARHTMEGLGQFINEQNRFQDWQRRAAGMQEELARRNEMPLAMRNQLEATLLRTAKEKDLKPDSGFASLLPNSPGYREAVERAFGRGSTRLPEREPAPASTPPPSTPPQSKTATTGNPSPGGVTGFPVDTRGRFVVDSVAKNVTTMDGPGGKKYRPGEEDASIRVAEEDINIDEYKGWTFYRVVADPATGAPRKVQVTSGKIKAGDVYVAKAPSTPVMDTGGDLGLGDYTLVGGSGPELLQNIGGRARVTPLTKISWLKPALTRPGATNPETPITTPSFPEETRDERGTIRDIIDRWRGGEGSDEERDREGGRGRGRGDNNPIWDTSYLYNTDPEKLALDLERYAAQYGTTPEGLLWELRRLALNPALANRNTRQGY
jgi:hypothetical protein